MNNGVFRASLFFLFIFITIGTLSAQALNFHTFPSDKIQFGFSFDKPFYANSIDLSTLSGVYQIYLNIPISSKFNIVSDIPYINTNYELNYGFGTYKYQKKGLGNIYIGLQTNPETIDNKRHIISFGVFLPTADEKASFNGLYTNYYDLQKYFPNSLGLYFNYAFYKINNEGLFYGFEAGPNIIIPTEDNGSENELLIHYGVNAGFNINKLSLSAEFLGIAIVSEHTDNFGDRLVNMLDFGAQWNEATITPKIFYKIYLKEDISNIIDGVLGLGVNVAID